MTKKNMAKKIKSSAGRPVRQKASQKITARKPSPRNSPSPLLRGHFIPNSHLDREWTLEYQQTRRLTVEFLDRLLDIFDQVPEYTFLLDSQTLPLEDYLEIRPENEARIRRAASDGRLQIGPWFSAPDPHTISGESIVRNLLRGHRSARRFGRPMKVGYTPFGFGQVSQLPQIYAGFGIDLLFFYRTITEYEAPQSEFFWEAPDGTRALCSRFGSKPRYNFFMDVWRPVAYGRGSGQRLYKWGEDGGVPFRRAGADREWDHYFLLRPEKRLHLELLESSFRKMLEVERRHFSTPVLPLMQGMDTTMPDPLEAEIIRELQKFLQPGEEVFFSTLERYAADMRAHLDLRSLKLFRGEMRHPGRPTPFTSTLESVGSSRPRQKRAHAIAENHLQRLAEPFAALASIAAGAPYPASYLDRAWRYLLLCHPHDTVGGTGVDKLETDSLYRLDQVKAISEFVIDDALGALQLRIDTSALPADRILLTVFNPTPRPRTEVIDAYLDIPKDSPLVECEIAGPDGRVADFQYVHRKPGEKTVRDNTDLTMALVCWTTKIQLRVENLPPMGWRTYIVRPAPAPGVNRRERIAASPHFMENEYLTVTVNADGTLDLREKSSGRVWRGLHALTDNGERGNNWESRAAHLDQMLSSRGVPVSIALVENTALSATIRVRYSMRVPSGLVTNDSHHYTQRGEHEENLVIDSFFTLRKGARRLDVHTEFDNRARNHRLRVHFPTGLAAAREQCAETPYDVVERRIDRDDAHPYAQADNPSYPMLRFVDVSDGRAGLAVMGKGLHEYEVTDDPSRTIALTLLRAYEVTLCTVSYRWERRPDQAGSQALGPIACDYAIFPHDGDWERGAVMREADDFFLPLVPAQTSRAEASRGGAPLESAQLELRPDSLVLSALKRAEDNPEAFILRVFNPASKALKRACAVLPRPVASARIVNLNEEPVADAPAPRIAAKGREVQFDIGPRKILTLELRFRSA